MGLPSLGAEEAWPGAPASSLRSRPGTGTSGGGTCPLTHSGCPRNRAGELGLRPSFPGGNSSLAAAGRPGLGQQVVQVYLLLCPGVHSLGGGHTPSTDFSAFPQPYSCHDMCERTWTGRKVLNRSWTQEADSCFLPRGGGVMAQGRRAAFGGDENVLKLGGGPSLL